MGRFIENYYWSLKLHPPLAFKSESFRCNALLPSPHYEISLEASGVAAYILKSER